VKHLENQRSGRCRTHRLKDPRDSAASQSAARRARCVPEKNIHAHQSVMADGLIGPIDGLADIEVHLLELGAQVLGHLSQRAGVVAQAMLPHVSLLRGCHAPNVGYAADRYSYA